MNEERTYKVLTLTQPWATLVALGYKVYETRSWQTFYRGDILIHASKTFPIGAKRLCHSGPFRLALSAGGYDSWSDLPTGALVGICRLAACARTEAVLSSGAVVRETPEWSFGDWSAGRYAWTLEDARALAEPVPYKGALGLWTYRGDVRCKEERAQRHATSTSPTTRTAPSEG